MTFTELDEDALFRLMEKGRVFAYLGMERSGHHAVLNWIHSQLPGTTFHVGRYTTDRCRARWFTEPGQAQYASISYGRDFSLSQDIPEFPTVVLVRDIRNMTASRMKMVGPDHAMLTGDMLGIWRQYAEQVLGDKDYLGDKAIPLVFDRWFRSREYRRRVLERLNSITGWNIPFTDDGLQTVSPIGRGSSFDGMDYDGKAQEMSVLNRWNQVDGVVRRVPPALLELNKRLI